MTASPNPISPRTPDTASTLFASPSRAPKPQSDARFRDSLDQRVARDEPRSRPDSETVSTSDRATGDAQNSRPRAEDADRDPELRDSSVEKRGADEGETVDPESPGSGDAQPAHATSTQPADGAAPPQVIPTGALEIKPIPSGQAAANTRTFAEESPPQTQVAPQNTARPQQGVARPAENADASRDQPNESPTLRLAGTDADTTTDAHATTDNAARNAAPVDRPEASQANHSGSNDRPATVEQSASLAGSTASQGETSGRHDQNDSSHRDPNAVKLPTLDPGAATPADRGAQVESIATTESRPADAPTLRGPVLSVTKVSDAEAAQNERAIASSVSRGLAAAVQQRGGSLTIRLTPATLGTVKIDLELAQGRVAVDLHASSDLAQEAISKNISLLRSSLESKGLTVDRIAVQLTPSANQSNNANSSGANDQQQGDAQQDRDASDGESRGSRDGRDEREQHKHFDQRFSEAFGLEPGDPRAQTLRLRLSAIG